jgi:hypothetical protein
MPLPYYSAQGLSRAGRQAGRMGSLSYLHTPLTRVDRDLFSSEAPAMAVARAIRREGKSQSCHETGSGWSAGIVGLSSGWGRTL